VRHGGQRGTLLSTACAPGPAPAQSPSPRSGVICGRRGDASGTCGAADWPRAGGKTAATLRLAVAESINSRLEQLGYPLPGVAKPAWVKVDAVARGLVGSRLLALLLVDIAELDGTYTAIKLEADELGISKPHRPQDDEFAAAARRYQDAMTLLQE